MMTVTLPWLYWPRSMVTPSGHVNFCQSLRKIKGKKKLFQVPVKTTMARVVRAGPIKGSMICARMRAGPAPSMRAASSSSSGMVSRYWRSRKTPKMLVSEGRMRDAWVLGPGNAFRGRAARW